MFWRKKPEPQKEPEKYPDLIIEFGKSRSSNFQLALHLAQKISTFRDIQDNDTSKYQIAFNLESIKDFVQIGEIVADWKNTSFFRKDISFEKMDRWRLISMYKCYLTRDEYKNKDYYCSLDHSGRPLVIPCRLMNFTIWRLSQCSKKTDSLGNIYLDQDLVSWSVENSVKQTLATYCPVLMEKTGGKLNIQVPSKINQSDLYVNSEASNIRLLINLPESLKKVIKTGPEQNNIDDLLIDVDKLDEFK